VVEPLALVLDADTEPHVPGRFQPDRHLAVRLSPVAVLDGVIDQFPQDQAQPGRTLHARLGGKPAGLFHHPVHQTQV